MNTAQAKTVKKTEQFSFSVEKNEFIKALSTIQGICSKKTPLETTSCVMLKFDTTGELIIQATNLDASLQYSLPVEVEGKNLSPILVNGKRLFELTKDLGNFFNFSFDGSRLHVNSDDDNCKLNLSLATSSWEEFPQFPEKIENLMEVSTSTLFVALKKLLSLVPQGSANPALNGMLIKYSKSKLSFVATDGHCLASLEETGKFCKEDYSWTVPKSSAIELKKIIDNLPVDSTVFIGQCKAQLVFSNSSFIFFTRLINDPFPSYERALNCANFSEGTVSLSNFFMALKRTGCMLTGKLMPTTFSFSKECLQLSLDNKEVGFLDQNVYVKSFDSDKKVVVKFYSPYVLSAVQAFDSQDINFLVKNERSPLFFTEKNEKIKFSYMIMPIVLNS